MNLPEFETGAPHQPLLDVGVTIFNQQIRALNLIWALDRGDSSEPSIFCDGTGAKLRDMLCPTPMARLVDTLGRPYFLWDCDITLRQLEAHLAAPDDAQRSYWLAKVMRQAKPDDAIALAGTDEMRRLWPRIERSLGKARNFWAWYLEWTRDAG